METGRCPECQEKGRHAIGCRQDPLYPARQGLARQALGILAGNLGESIGPQPDARGVCRFYEAVLKVEYPGRRVAVTPAPLPEDVKVTETESLDSTGVLDVVLGALPNDPTWACFRVSVQRELNERAWVVAAQKVRQRAREEMAAWRSRALATAH